MQTTRLRNSMGYIESDGQTDGQTHRQTDRHDWKHYLPAYAGGKNILKLQCKIACHAE